MPFRSLLRAFTFSLVLLAPLSASADGRWTIHGPAGGNVNRIVFDPADSSIVYAATTNGLFRSGDGGHHWLAAPALLGTVVLDVAVAAGDPGIVFAASPYGLYKSSDRGLSWRTVQTTGAFKLAVSRENADLLYDASIAGVVRSTDGGVTFGTRGSGLPPGLPSAIAVDPRNDSIVYLAYQSSAGVYRSSDGGSSWVPSSSGLALSQVFALAVDPSNGTLYAAGSSGTIFKSSDGARSWKPLATGIGELTCSALAVSTMPANTILAATSRGPLISPDGGASWSRAAGFQDASSVAVAIDPLDPATFLAAVSYHVDRTDDGGATSARSDAGLSSFATAAIAIDPRDDGLIYAAGPGGVARSFDHGQTWSLWTALQAVKVAVDAGSTVYAVSVTVRRSVDAGNGWEDFGTGLPQAVPSFLVADPQVAGTLYAIVDGAVYKKVGEEPWVRRSDGLADSQDFVAVDPHSSSTLYAAGPAGVFKSSNGGASWVAANAGLTGLNTIGVAVDPFEPLHLFAWSPTQVFESTDGAGSWSLRPGVRGELHFDPASAHVIYANAFDGVQRSVDGGKTWVALSDGLPRTHSLLAVGRAGTLYLADTSGGVFVFSRGGRRRAVAR